MSFDTETFPNRDPSLCMIGHHRVINTLVDGALGHMQQTGADFDAGDWMFLREDENGSTTEPLARVITDIFFREFPNQANKDNLVNALEAARQFIATVSILETQPKEYKND